MQFRYIYFNIELVIHLFFGLFSTSCFASLALRSYRGNAHFCSDRQQETFLLYMDLLSLKKTFHDLWEAPTDLIWYKNMTWLTEGPSRFPCCVLSYFSLVFVMEHSRRWWLHIGGSKMFEPLFQAGLSFPSHFFCKIFVFDISKLNFRGHFLVWSAD